jgi:predicted  nucleic acid-binding Zn-ribbon protein
MKQVMSMSEDNFRKEIAELRERVAKIEVKIEELNRRFESLSNYSKELYVYLQKQANRPIF